MDDETDPLANLPLTLLGSDPIPPAPTRPGSIDFLHEFSGYSWVAYGAASLLVISHFPSPLEPQQTQVGPFLRQTFELSASHNELVNAVAWSPCTPSDGDVAAACGNCVVLFRNEASSVQGSFCWSQNAVLVQSTKVEAIEWTGSGDGIITGGIEVLLWKKRNRSWEIAWKFKGDQPQIMLSATWSIVGPSASVTNICNIVNSKCVSLYYGDGKHQYAKAELHHPQPVTLIKWRRSVGRQLDSDANYFMRNVLLTCCLDGTARLWCEIYDGKSRKVGKDNNDHKKVRRTFSVAAVIDVNRVLNGTLGSDVFLTWATEIKGIFNTSDGGKKFFTNEEYDGDNVGACEWLVGFGPGMLVSYWPIHCLDDISPIRFPRVMLWKKQKLKHKCLHGASFTNFQEPLLLNKAIIARNCLSGPPAICSLIHHLPSNSLAWSVFYSQVSNSTDESSRNNSSAEDFLSSSAIGVLKLNGHTGKILQVAVHPHSCEVDLAASLDSNGGLLFWSLSNINSCNVGLPNLLPAWELCGELLSRNFCSKYTSLRWAPSILDEDRFLFMGHVKGIDCFKVRFSQASEENVECNHFCTIPFTVRGPYDDGPTDIFTVPLTSTCGKTVRFDRFMLLGVWMKGFEALSWDVTMHTHNSSGCYSECNLDKEGASDCNMYNFESSFSGRNYCISIDPCSSYFPESQANDEVTSFSVVCTANMSLMEQKLGFSNDSCQKIPICAMATGCADGTLKLWRSEKASLTTPLVPWELVGFVTAHPGPILAISINNCGQKIATIGRDTHSTVLKIWDAVHLTGLGGYVLEDTITIDKPVVSLKWLTLGNGQSLLGVCMQHELHVYAQSRYGVQALTSIRRYKEVPNWSRVALAHILVPVHNFVWGPRATAIIIHHNYFTLYSQSLSLSIKDNNSKLHPPSIEALNCEVEMHKDHFSSVFTDGEIGDYKELLLGGDSGKFNSRPNLKINISESCLYNSFLMAWARMKRGPVKLDGLWSLIEVIERLGGFLPVYHPEALLTNICSGNWKRAIVSLRHLSESLTSVASQKRNGPGKSSYLIPQILLSNYFEQTMTNATDKGHQWGSSLTTSSSQSQTGVNLFALSMDSAASSVALIPSSTQSELCDISEILERNYELAAITEAEKLKTQAIIDLLSEVSDAKSVCAYASLDEPGRRYWVVLRFQQLLFYREFGRKPALEELAVDSSLVGWAFHSDCQENLFGCLLPTEPSWQEMRSLGVGYWFTNETELRKRMEKLARMQYLKKKDPKDCALLYIALNRIKVLAGLFKISKDEKDKPLVAFISRNFQDEKNKAAALKNAYVLLGRHQFELAIAFFLLGGDTISAITVCAKNFGDEQLALVLCRLVEGRGGQLQSHLITKILIPLAIEKSDHWLASLLEWELGNYSQSFLSMMGFHTTSVTKKLAISTNHIAFVDPNIGLYCQTLAANNRMRNAVGEREGVILIMWANFMTETALRRSGLLLEALECYSSSLSGPAIVDRDSASENVHSEVLPETLKPFAGKSSNWMLHDVSIFLERYAKSDMALQYLSKLIKEHPDWSDSFMGGFPGATKCSNECRMYPYEKLYDNFRLQLWTVLGEFVQKFSVIPAYLLYMAFLYTCNSGVMFIGYDILHGYASQNDSESKQQLADSLFMYFCPYKPLLKVSKELSFLSSRFIFACSMTGTNKSKPGYTQNEVSGEITSNWSDVCRYYLQGLLLSCWNLRASLRIMPGHPTEDIISGPLNVLDLVEYYMYVSSAWLSRNSEVLLLMVQPVLSTSAEGQTPNEDKSVHLKRLIHQNEELLAHHLLKIGSKQNIQVSSNVQIRNEDIMHSVPEDELWHIIGAFLWQQLFRFLKSQSTLDCDNAVSSCLNGAICSVVSNLGSCSGESESDSERTAAYTKLVSVISIKLLKTTLVHLSSFQVKQLALFLRKKVENGTYSPTLLRLEQSCRSSPMGPGQNPKEGSVTQKDSVTQKTDSTEDELSNFQALCSLCDDSHFIAECLMLESIDWLHYFKHKTSRGWMDFHKYISEDHKNEDSYSLEGKIRGNPAKTETVSHNQNQTKNSHTPILQKETVLTDEVTLFQKPKEVYKRNGELLEALCTNSINQQEAAIASNRKGIVFFNWDNGMPSLDQADYIWSDADWPHDGWAGSQSTPVPTCVSPGVGLGSNKGAHLGLGGATIGMGSIGRPQRSFSGGGAFGVPSYAGNGASGLGWEVQADFEEFIDPPATVENIVTRAFSSHPSRPLFLVGSVNTHIYLWEFGKDTATATYGVMPAANVPPPYALASLSALQFDHFGHRFASAALDGTICTWQLEVGGRSNIYPIESYLCFNNHARDVAFVTSSGSIVAAAGYSSNGVNVVVWDTLAPPATSRASIICHEGGARSISVFDNDIGSGSVSPFIVTGGKTGDIGLHDFRYIATGKTKRHRQANDNERSTSLSTDGKHGDQNANGMLWYIPKAHSGNVAKIATIPNTSLFLTGSKDGDVKLWDAKRARLVHHWPKLHDRHTFLQPSSSRGFGEVVRAAVTDIQITSHGFLTCGGDGSVKLIQFKDYRQEWGF